MDLQLTNLQQKYYNNEQKYVIGLWGRGELADYFEILCRPLPYWPGFSWPFPLSLCRLDARLGCLATGSRAPAAFHYTLCHYKELHLHILCYCYCIPVSIATFFIINIACPFLILFMPLFSPSSDVFKKIFWRMVFLCHNECLKYQKKKKKKKTDECTEQFEILKSQIKLTLNL